MTEEQEEIICELMIMNSCSKSEGEGKVCTRNQMPLNYIDPNEEFEEIFDIEDCAECRGTGTDMEDLQEVIIQGRKFSYFTK